MSRLLRIGKLFSLILFLIKYEEEFYIYHYIYSKKKITQKIHGVPLLQSVKFEKAPIKKASTKKPPKMKTSNKKASHKKKTQNGLQKRPPLKMTNFEILFEQEFYDLTLLLYKYFIRGGGGLMLKDGSNKK